MIAHKVGRDLSLELAREAARIMTLHGLARLRAELGSLDQVRSVLKVFGMRVGFNQPPCGIDAGRGRGDRATRTHRGGHGGGAG